MPSYKFALFFAPIPSGGSRKPISEDTKRNITALAAMFDPKPVRCVFDTHGYGLYFEGEFFLEFIAEANTQFEATEIAANVSKQATNLNFERFRHETSNPHQCA